MITWNEITFKGRRKRHFKIYVEENTFATLNLMRPFYSWIASAAEKPASPSALTSMQACLLQVRLKDFSLLLFESSRRH